MIFHEWVNSPQHNCLPYCSGSRYQLRDDSHVVDVVINDDADFDGGICLAYSQLNKFVDILGFWQEMEFLPDYSNVTSILDGAAQDGTRYKKYPPTLFLLKEKDMKRKPHTQKMVDDFNEKYKSGQEVIYYKLINPKEYPIKTKIRSLAWLMGGHTAVVLVEGLAGGVSLDAIEVLNAL